MDICGARKQNGQPCRQRALFCNGRCKFHGGLSTGPKTEAGREQSRINGRLGGRPRTVISDTPMPNDKVSSRVAEVAPIEPTKNTAQKPKSGTLEKPDVSAAGEQRCTDCRQLAENQRCLAAARGVIEGGIDYRPEIDATRNCVAFRHWKT
jgi:hypothetical protein